MTSLAEQGQLVYQMRQESRFSFAVPSSHRAKWKLRTLRLGVDHYPMDRLVQYLRKLNLSLHYELALRDAAHALITGLGLLFVFKETDRIVDIIDLVPFLLPPRHCTKGIIGLMCRGGLVSLSR